MRRSALLAAVVAVVSLGLGSEVHAVAALPGGSPAGTAAAKAQAYNQQSSAAWRSVNADGIPAALAAPRWGDAPYAVGFGVFGLERWTYSRFPLPCNPPDSPLPSYQVLWVESMRQAPTVMDRRPGLVRRTVRRVASIFAASANLPIRSGDDLRQSLIPRFVTETDRTSGVCRPRVERVRVPTAVLRREAIQNWVNPATGAREQGLFPYLQSHGYPARADRRVLAIVADLRSPDYSWWGAVGEAQALGIGTGYGPLDDRPDQQNANNAGGLSAAVFTDGSAWDLQPGSGELAGVIAHEIAHGLGAVLPTAPHHNDLNFAHAADCADVMCYNAIGEAGQDYQACSRATEQSFASFARHGGDLGRSSLRLDCHRDDYFAQRADGSGEKPWAEQRWSISRNRFLWGNQHREPYAGRTLVNPDVPPSCLADPDGYCPPGVEPSTTGAPRRSPGAASTWTVS